MTVVTVLYPTSDATSDHDYYAANHIPMVERIWGPMGMTGVVVEICLGMEVTSYESATL